MRIAYFDCFAGISGEMLLGALLGAGLSRDALQTTLSGLDLPCYELCVQEVVRKELSGTYPSIIIKGHAGDGNGLHEIGPAAEITRPGDPEHEGRSCDQAYSPVQIIGKARLPDLIKETSLAIFRRLTQAEAAVCPQNGKAHTGARPVEEIVSVVGVVASLSLLSINRVECSPIQVGSGVLYSAEGVRPALSPVAAEILRTASVPVFGSYIAGELVSPIGLAIITTIASAFGAMPTMKIDSVGYGAGKYDLKETSSLLRVFIGETGSATGQLHMVHDPSRDQPATLPAASTPSLVESEDEAAATAPVGRRYFHHQLSRLDRPGRQRAPA